MYGTCECGAPVKLRPATAEEAYQAGYDAVEGEYLAGRCRRLHDDEGRRVHYGYPLLVIHKSDAREQREGSTMSKHTPGPWETQGLQVIHIEPMEYGETLTTLVASCHTCAFENGEQNANAALIAAAPDMYEALRECITDEGAVAMRGISTNARKRLDYISEIARAALAKAGGES